MFLGKSGLRSSEQAKKNSNNNKSGHHLELNFMIKTLYIFNYIFAHIMKKQRFSI
jgi:hypothetical protein